MPTPEDHHPSSTESSPSVIRSTDELTEAEYFNSRSKVADIPSFLESCYDEFFSEPLRPGIQLEVGFGRRPFDPDRSYALPLHTYTRESPYIGIDGGSSITKPGSGPGWLEYSDPIRRKHATVAVRRAEHDKEQRQDAEFIQFVLGDAKKLPLRDGSVQSIYLKDVLLAAGVIGMDMENMFKEFQRVMKSGALLTIVETETNSRRPAYPYWGSGDCNHVVLGKALRAAGFEQRALDDMFIFARKSTEGPTPRKSLEKGWSRNLPGLDEHT